MKLFYYKTTNPSKNFGDEINPWLWPRLLPPFDNNTQDIFVGIGTVLNDAAPAVVNSADNAIFFSTGAGYGRSLRFQRPLNWRIYCVRGPLSASRLKLSPQAAITDGAALLKRFFDPIASADRIHHFSYMPHFRHGSPHRMKAVCERLGIHFIDPSGEVEDVILEISQSEVLISEAMHGAIVADTLRVPWIPVRTSPKILLFKWQDWCASVKLPYEYQLIKGVKSLSKSDYLYPIRPFLQRQGSVASLFDGVSISSSFRFCEIGKPAEMSEESLDALCKQLTAVTQVTPYLSRETYLESLVVRLEERLDDLKQDICKGSFLL